MSDETKPVEGEETNLAATADTTPATGSEGAGGEASQSEGQPTQEFTPEQHAAAIKGMNEAQRKAAELEQQLATYQAQSAAQQQAIDSLMGRQAAQTDPEEAARQEYLAAAQEYDEAAKFAAMTRWQQAREQKMRQQIMEETVRQQQLLASMPKAQQMLGVNDQNALSTQLGQVHSSITPDELALVQLARQNKLGDFVAQQQSEADQKRQQAEALQSIGQGLGGGGRIPGAKGPRKIEIPYQEWAVANPEAKQRIREDDQHEYVITDAPKHFDPEKD